jgi:hypothetical protein
MTERPKDVRRPVGDHRPAGLTRQERLALFHERTARRSTSTTTPSTSRSPDDRRPSSRTFVRI